MGAKVGILDADIYGPSLPTMVKPDPPVLQMDPETRAIRPPEFEGVKVVSFGFAGQGSAIMRGPMVSGTSPASQVCPNMSTKIVLTFCSHHQTRICCFAAANHCCILSLV